MIIAKNKDSGRSLIEMLGVLAIIGVLSVGSLNGYQKATGKLKVHKTLDQIASISTSLRTLYIQQPSYEGLNNASAVEMQVIPLDMGTGDVLFSPFRGNVTIGTGNAFQGETGNSHRAFYLIYDKLNRQSCVELASADWSGKGVSILGVGVFGSSISRDKIDEIAVKLYDKYEGYNGEYGIATPNGKILKLPIPLTTAAKLCDCGAQNLSCTLLWKYM